jgi:hypothetical protein
LFDPYFRANKSHPCSLTLIYNLIIFNSILRKEKSLDFTPSIYNSSVTSHLNVIDQIKKIKKKKKPLPTMLYIYIVMLYEFFFLIDWCTWLCRGVIELYISLLGREIVLTSNRRQLISIGEVKYHLWQIESQVD